MTRMSQECRQGIDEMVKDVETQLVEELRSRKTSIHTDESIVRDTEAVLRYPDNDEFS